MELREKKSGIKGYSNGKEDNIFHFHSSRIKVNIYN